MKYINDDIIAQEMHLETVKQVWKSRNSFNLGMRFVPTKDN